jgi:DNA-binding transcriptional regulator YiaG
MDGSMTRYEFYIKGCPKLAKPFHFAAVGLPNVYLLSGVTIEDDPDYGRIVTVEKMEDLYRAIGLRVTLKDEALTGDEMRFLRKEMGLTQTELAKRLRVNSQTVANYEKGKTERGAADAAMRLLYLSHKAPSEHLALLSKGINTGTGASSSNLPAATLRKLSGRWSDAARAAA